MADHYSNLGVREGAEESEIKAAYRKLAREFHPDRNPSEAAAERFLSIKDSYETLMNPDRRKIYDRFRQSQVQAEPVREAAPEPKVRVESGNDRVRTAGYFRDGRNAWEQERGPDVSKDEFLRLKGRLKDMQKFVGKGRWGEATGIADEIIRAGMNEPLAYAVLGDAARLRGDFLEAAKQFGFAVQFDPGNEVYESMHVAMMDASHRKKPRVARDPGENNFAAFMVGMVVVAAGICYTAIAKELPVFPDFALLSTWTLGQIGWILIGGLAMGASLSASDLLDHFDLGGGAAGYRVHPGVMVGLLSLFNFWIGFGVYVLVGLSQKSFHQSLSRLVGFVVVGTVGFGFARLGVGWEAVAQTLLWAGTGLYFSGILGWVVADSLRRV